MSGVVEPSGGEARAGIEMPWAFAGLTDCSGPYGSIASAMQTTPYESSRPVRTSRLNTRRRAVLTSILFPIAPRKTLSLPEGRTD